MDKKMRRLHINRVSAIKWIVPLVLGFLSVLATFAIYRALHPYYPPDIVMLSKDMHLSMHQTLYLKSAYNRIIAGAPPESDEWRAMLQLADSSDVEQNRFALSVMATLKRTKYRQDAIRCAERLLDSPDSHVKAFALADLARLGDSQWKDVAVRHQADPDPVIRKAANTLLERQERFK